MSAGQNISSKILLCDLFFNRDSNISPMIFHSQPCVEHTLAIKKTPHDKNIFLNMTLHISKISSFLDLKQNKRLLDN